MHAAAAADAAVEEGVVVCAAAVGIAPRPWHVGLLQNTRMVNLHSDARASVIAAAGCFMLLAVNLNCDPRHMSGHSRGRYRHSTSAVAAVGMRGAGHTAKALSV